MTPAQLRAQDLLVQLETLQAAGEPVPDAMAAEVIRALAGSGPETRAALCEVAPPVVVDVGWVGALSVRPGLVLYAERPPELASTILHARARDTESMDVLRSLDADDQFIAVDSAWVQRYVVSGPERIVGEWAIPMSRAAQTEARRRYGYPSTDNQGPPLAGPAHPENVVIKRVP